MSDNSDGKATGNQPEVDNPVPGAAEATGGQPDSADNVHVETADTESSEPAEPEQEKSRKSAREKHEHLEKPEFSEVDTDQKFEKFWQKVQRVQGQLKAARQTKFDLETKLTTLKAESEKLKDKLKEAGKKAKSWKTQVENHDKLETNLRKNFEETLQHNQREFQAQLDALDKANQELNSQVRKLISEVEKLESKLKEENFRHEEEKKAADSHKEEAKRLQTELQDLKTRFDTVSSDLDYYKNKCAQQETVITQWEDTNSVAGSVHSATEAEEEESDSDHDKSDHSTPVRDRADTLVDKTSPGTDSTASTPDSVKPADLKVDSPLKVDLQTELKMAEDQKLDPTAVYRLTGDTAQGAVGGTVVPSAPPDQDNVAPTPNISAQPAPHFMAETGEEEAEVYMKPSLAGQITKFSGRNKRQTATSKLNEVEDWLEDKIDAYNLLSDPAKAKVTNYTKVENKVKKFKSCLEGEARDWFQSLDLEEKFQVKQADDWTLEKWDQLKKAFLNQFGEDGTGDFEQRQKFKEMKWDPSHEKVQRFAMRVDRLGKQLEKSKMDIKMAFVDGLPRSCARGIIVTPSKSLDDLIQEVVQLARFNDDADTDLSGKTLSFNAARAQPPADKVSSPQSDPVTLEVLKTLKGIQEKLDSPKATNSTPPPQPSFHVNTHDIVKELREDRQNGELVNNVHKLLRKAESQNEAAKQQFDALKAEFQGVRSSFNAFHQFQENTGGQGRGGFGFRGRGRGRGGFQGSNQGRPGEQNRKFWDIPNPELWKENIRKGWCALHGIRGKTHLLENCTVAKALIEKGKIHVDNENMITVGAGTRQFLPLN